MRCYHFLATLLCLQSALRHVAGYTPVSPKFKNICALTTEKIEAFILCARELAQGDGKHIINEEFDALVKPFLETCIRGNSVTIRPALLPVSKRNAVLSDVATGDFYFS